MDIVTSETGFKPRVKDWEKKA